MSKFPAWLAVCSFGICIPLAGLPRGAYSADSPAMPSHKEMECIGASKETKFESLSSFCLNSDGNLMCCDDKASLIKIITPAGKLLKTWKLPFGPHRIHCAGDGTIYVGGDDVIARLDKDGKVTAKVEANGTNFPKARISGIATTDKHVFISIGSGWSLRAIGVICRFDRDLGAPKEIARDLKGCCQRLDLAAKDGILYVAENARKRILLFDVEGKVLSSWDRASRDDVEGFGSCCNPMNIRFGPGGEVFTSESNLGRIKRFQPDGQFLGIAAEVKIVPGCKHVAIGVSSDGKRLYLLDITRSHIVALDVRDAAAVTAAK